MRPLLNTSPGSSPLKKFYLGALLVLLATGSIVARPVPDEFVSHYNDMDLDFLRTHYLSINNGRSLRIEGTFSDATWLQPFKYKQALHDIGFDVDKYNLIQLSIKEKDDFHYSFPILFFHREAGDLTELDQLKKGERVAIYGRFYNLKKSEYAFEVDLVETIQKGGHDRDILINGLVDPTLTPTPTFTNTPGPNLFQRVNNLINPKESPTPTGTITPEANSGK